MKVELEPIAGFPESYTVTGIEDDERGVRLKIGTIARGDGDEWLFTLRPEGSDKGLTAITLRAADVEALKAVIRDRFGMLEMNADRLRDETMLTYADDAMRNLSALATRTKTVVGFTRALCINMALVAVVDVPESERETFLDDCMRKVRAAIVEETTKRDSRVELKGRLRNMLDSITGRDKKADDDEPTKH